MAEDMSAIEKWAEGALAGLDAVDEITLAGLKLSWEAFRYNDPRGKALAVLFSAARRQGVTARAVLVTIAERREL